MKYFGGLDVGRTKADFCIIDETGRNCFERIIPLDSDIISEIGFSGFSLELIGLESGSMSSSLIDQLTVGGQKAVCIEARHANAIMSQSLNKSDKSDARQIAKLTMLGWYKSVYTKSYAARVSRSMLIARRAMIDKMLSLKRTLRDLRTELDLGKSGNLAINRRSDSRLCELRVSGISKMLLIIQKCIDRGQKDIKMMSKLILERVRSDAVCILLMTVPGVGPLTALCFRATIDDPHRFKRSRDVGAYLGLTPRRYQSGRLDHQSRISKRGDKLTRGALFNAALVTICKGMDCRIKQWGECLRERKSLKKARIAVARKLSCIMHRMWISNRPFDPFYGL